MCQYIRNKTATFHDYLCEKRVDLCALTETWLSANDAAVKAEYLAADIKSMITHILLEEEVVLLWLLERGCLYR